MSKIYRNLACNALAKNKIVYVPYILSSAMMVTISYIIMSLVTDPVISEIEGGESLQMLMVFGIFVMFSISFFFLISVSRFVIKQRKKELGLYSVLGMQKKHIIHVQWIENLIVFLISTSVGTIVGIVLSKVMQLGILKMYHAEADFGWSIQILPCIAIVGMFAVTFFFIFLVNTLGILRANTLEYMKEESKGEKKPKSNWILAIVGVLLLAAGYYLAMRSQTTVSAFEFFFIAVMLVIFGTIALFTAGSITILNTLKKKKNYYYKTGHFISISGMLYRMKRNAAMLATICIFATMVLVTLSSVITLYTTINKLVTEWYRVDFDLVYEREDEEGDLDAYVEELRKGAEEVGLEIEQIVHYQYLDGFAQIKSGKVITYPSYYAMDTVEVFILPVETYNLANGGELVLERGQLGVYSHRGDLTDKQLSFQGMDAGYELQKEVSQPFEVIEVDRAPEIGYGTSITLSDGVFFLIMNDEDFKEIGPYISSPLLEDRDRLDRILINSSSDRETQLKYYNYLYDNHARFGFFYLTSRVQNCDEVMGIYGGLFFLGLFLSVAFLTITILNMYFTQLQQGYEDSRRFAIMRKVGLTRKEIKKSINSQIVFVFLLPLVVAVIHTAAAYPMVNRILQLLGGCEPLAFMAILGGCIVVFAVVYTIAYLATRRTYLKLVSGT